MAAFTTPDKVKNLRKLTNQAAQLKGRQNIFRITPVSSVSLN